MRLLVFGLATLAVQAGSVQAEVYRIVDLQPLPGHTVSAANAINELGEIVGQSSGGSRGLSAATVCLWRNGEVIELWRYGKAWGINDSTEIVGHRIYNVNDLRAVVWRNEELIDLDIPTGIEDSVARDINESGRILGDITGAAKHGAVMWDTNDALLGIIFDGLGVAINDSNQAVGGSPPSLWEGGFVTTITEMLQASDINALGTVVGETAGQEPRQACTWTDGAFALLPQFDERNKSRPTAINGHGVIVGQLRSCRLCDDDEAAIWDDDSVSRLMHRIRRNPGWTWLGPEDINDRGEIVGRGVNPAGEVHAFLLIPVSEQDTDLDGDVDLLDFAALQNAFTGPAE